MLLEISIDPKSVIYNDGTNIILILPDNMEYPLLSTIKGYNMKDFANNLNEDLAVLVVDENGKMSLEE